jgi:tRNA nucleotidyltransferase (CCA-adding enzyme)
MNVSDNLVKRLSPTLLSILRETSKLASTHGVEVFLVGGMVRDVLAGFQPRDPDIMATGGFPEFPLSVAERFGGELLKTTEFGTTSVRIQDIDLDLSTARRETYERPGALPTVFPGTVEEDLARRDFSINAMAISLSPDSWGELLDLNGGVQDLQIGRIRVLHDESFRDDATRMLRAIRYACRNGHRLEPHTKALIKRDLHYLDTLGGDRIRHEIEYFFIEQRVADMIEMAQELGVLSAVHPALRIYPNVLAGLRNIQLEQADDIELRLLALLVQSVTADAAESVIERLHMNSDWARVIRDVVTVRAVSRELADENEKRSRIYEILHDLDPIAIESCTETATDPTAARWLHLYLDELHYIRPLLQGDDLLALGVPKGPKIGRLLCQLLNARMNGLTTTKDDEKAFVIRSMSAG